MKKNSKIFKALALLSGGLDSILAIKIIQLQGIEVEAVVFKSNFYSARKGIAAADFLNIKYHVIDLSEKTIKLIENPKYGFGKNLNPCIDCHLLMISEAGKLLKKLNADFIITGEVVGQRPKSQSYAALKLIEKNCGVEGKLLRPLSAKKLPVTEIESRGIVDREKLLDIAGKSRKFQMVLAEKFNIKNYPSPGGGCLLTVSSFSDRLRFNLKYKKLSPIDIELLKLGRHFVTEKNNKIIIGREQSENEMIMKLIDNAYLIFELYNEPGPITLLTTIEPDYNEIKAAASLTVRYSKFRNNKNVSVKYYKKDFLEYVETIVVNPMEYTQLNLKLL